ncbi:uncharacterized protein AMSG_02925 [Thecamonas trahens ATCC 50062]|uniref:Uncharacterized protein n=1 Tax=Thecamonas trahens ATCC 50062 TaxID=461836 RepID=A0A0L0D2T1_THETB|nr:hypothetical protein AMSG_02925 [Thecamonas trahens ATCC 50062]KNC46490.1 hypothetical protein AMSG_02925 [Thecamonas trahens ATCC 50062]|eukprot:XP_013760271.1 hypothetical protein AMSG_02925 [Thecamonas trahens ATCC 50062]
MRSSLEATITARIEAEVRRRTAANQLPPPLESSAPPSSATSLASILAENAELKATVRDQDATIVALRRQLATMQAAAAAPVYGSPSPARHTPPPRAPSPRPPSPSALTSPVSSLSISHPSPLPNDEVLDFSGTDLASHLSFRRLGTTEPPLAAWAVLVDGVLTAYDAKPLAGAPSLPAVLFSLPVNDGSTAVKVIGEAIGEIKFVLKNAALPTPYIVFADNILTRDAWVDAIENAGAADFTTHALPSRTLPTAPSPGTPAAHDSTDGADLNDDISFHYSYSGDATPVMVRPTTPPAANVSDDEDPSSMGALPPEPEARLRPPTPVSTTLFSDELSLAPIGSEPIPCTVKAIAVDSGVADLPLSAHLDIAPTDGSPPKTVSLTSDTMIKPIGMFIEGEHKVLIKAPSTPPIILLTSNGQLMTSFLAVLGTLTNA